MTSTTRRRCHLLALAPTASSRIQNPNFADLEADVEQRRGLNLIHAAHEADVRHFIQTKATGTGDYYHASG